MADAYAENQSFSRGNGDIDGAPGGTPNGAKPVEQSETESDNAELLRRSRTILSSSTNHWETSYNTQWKKSISHFNSRHAPGSKYTKEAYATRSKSFRPKTRSAVRKNEAACATAFFSTSDPLTIKPTSHSDERQVMSAAVYQSIIRHRLRNRMPWVQTVLGAYQDTQVMGACFSHNYWKFETDKDDEVTCDELAVELIPPQNIRFHPRSDWRDPINTSPYLVHIYEKTVDEVRLKMENGEWNDAKEPIILSAAREWDPIDAERDTKAAHENATGNGLQDHETVWISKIIERRRGIDYCHFVLGEHFILTEPERLDELMPGGIRNYTMGVCNIEAHKVIPAGTVELYQEVQEVTNEVMNSRMDNVNLSIRPRFLTKRDSNIDHKALSRSVPGGIIDTDDPKNDVEQLVFPDVTASSFKEQDYHSADFDEIAGNFSSSSVNTNRRMGETVGGMELLTGDANMMMEYQLRIFSETWVRKTLQQFVLLEQAFETDMHMKVMAANENMELLLRYGVDEITDELLEQDLVCDVSVGIDATNPDRRLQRFNAGVQTMMGMQVPPNTEEIMKETWGILGFGDGSRFTVPKEEQEQQGPSPEQQVAEMEGQKMQMELQSQQMEMQGKQVDGQVKQQIAQMTLERENLSLQRDQLQSQSAQMDAQVKEREVMAKLEEAQNKYQVEMEKMQLDMRKLSEQIKSAERIALLNDETNRLKIKVDADNKVEDRMQKTGIEMVKVKEQSRQADEGRLEQQREFDENQAQQEKIAKESNNTEGGNDGS